MELYRQYVRAKTKTDARDFEPYIPVDDELHVGGMVCLYLYVSQNQLEHIMKDKALKLSRTQKTNDITENLASGEHNIASSVKEHGYICLSETINSPMMWGQYADRSRGACLVFGVLLLHASECYGYSPKRDGYRLFFSQLDAGRLDFNAQRDFIYVNRINYTNTRVSTQNVYEVMSTKSVDWEHERECRIIVPLDSIGDHHCIEDSNGSFSYKYLYDRIMPALKRVILGPENQANDVDMERKLNKTFHRSKEDRIRVFRASVSDTDFSIVVPHQKPIEQS